MRLAAPSTHTWAPTERQPRRRDAGSWSADAARGSMVGRYRRGRSKRRLCGAWSQPLLLLGTGRRERQRCRLRHQVQRRRFRRRCRARARARANPGEQPPQLGVRQHAAGEGRRRRVVHQGHHTAGGQRIETAHERDAQSDRNHHQNLGQRCRQRFERPERSGFGCAGEAEAQRFGRVGKIGGTDRRTVFRIETREFRDEWVGWDTDGRGVVAQVGAAKQSSRPLRHVAAFEPIEERKLDLGGLGNRRQGDTLTFPLHPQLRAERVVTDQRPSRLGETITEPGRRLNVKPCADMRKSVFHSGARITSHFSGDERQREVKLVPSPSDAACACPPCSCTRPEMAVSRVYFPSTENASSTLPGVPPAVG